MVALIDSLDGDEEAATTKAWADEVRKRKAELRSGEVEAQPWDAVRARLSAL